MALNIRSEIERQIVSKILDGALAAGLKITVNDGEEDVLLVSEHRPTIEASMASTDEDTLIFSRSVPPVKGKPTFVKAGYVNLIYGNGADVIADHSMTLYTDPEDIDSPLVEWFAPAWELAMRLSE